MGDKTEQTTGTPEKHYVKGLTGRDYQTASEEHAAQYIAGGGKPESKEEAYRGAAASSDLARIDEMGGAEKAAYGVGSGLTLGLGPAAMAGLGLIDPNTLSALGTSGAYQAGDVAGMVAPALLSGGEAVGARGVIARAMGATPAGLLGRAGTVAEALAGRILPEAGVMGKLARPAFQMATRGAAEGALVNLSHTASDAIIHDKPLTWAAISASSVDGALMGGLVGGAFGAAGSVLGRGADAMTSVAGGAGGEASAAKALRRLGAGGKDLASLGESEGGVIGSVKKYHDLLENGGESFASSTPAVLKVAKKAIVDSQTTSSEIIKTLDKEAPNMLPDMGRVLGRMNTDLETKYSGTLQHSDALSTMQGLQEHMASIDGWKGWAASRSQLSEIAQNSKNTVQSEVYHTALNALDSEIRKSMEIAADSISKPGLSQSYHGALMTETIAKELAEMVGKRSAKEALGKTLRLTGSDFGSLAYSTLLGHPLGGAAIVSGKKLAQHAANKLEPAIAESAYRSALGAEAGAATAKVGSRMSESIKKFISTAPRLAAKASGGGIVYNKESLDKSLSSTENLTNDMHKAKVEQFANSMAMMGHPEMAKEAMDQYQRASDYLNYNKPVSGKVKQAGQMGKIPAVMGLSTKDMKFLRIDRAIKNPLSLLDDLENGSLSREAVKAVKYVYPTLHQDLVFRASQEMLAAKQEGKFVPADKIAMLGTVLDAPIDSKLEKPFIDAVQSALATNSQPQPKPQPNAPPGPAPIISESSTFQTPVQNALQS